MRNEARIKVDIWRDEDFLALPERAQLLYFFLLSQPELTWAGVLSLTPRRWAATLHQTGEMIEAALTALADARFVIIDADTEELLVRTFVRHSGALYTPNVLKNATTMAERVGSPKIRAALDVELSRNPLPNPWGNRSRYPSPKVSVNGSVNPSPNTATSTSTSTRERPVDNSRPNGTARPPAAGASTGTPYPKPVKAASRADLAWSFAEAQPGGSLETDVRLAAQQEWPFDPAMRDAAVGAWLTNREGDDF